MDYTPCTSVFGVLEQAFGDFVQNLRVFYVFNGVLMQFRLKFSHFGSENLIVWCYSFRLKDCEDSDRGIFLRPVVVQFCEVSSQLFGQILGLLATLSGF